MNNFNLKDIMARHNLREDEMAKLLYPDAKYPQKALSRVLDGKAELRVSQLERLSKHIGCSIQCLFDSDWTTKADKYRVTFTRGEYHAVVHGSSPMHLVLYTGEVEVAAWVLDSEVVSFKDVIDKIENYIEVNNVNSKK